MKYISTACLQPKSSPEPLTSLQGHELCFQRPDVTVPPTIMHVPHNAKYDLTRSIVNSSSTIQ